MPKNKKEEEEYTERIEHVDLESVLGTSYINYSMSVIVDRAIPDVRDGLKPVQRRIAYSMYRMGLTHGVPFKKCATIVGDVLGHYHPHGDASVYDALARLAQDFSLRYPLIEGHGNFGSMDGDPPAAYRYTEARMSPVMEELLRDIDKDTVDWSPNFDGTLKEPDVLPARLPNLLINGTSGIAVGMSSKIPPHNLGEITDAAVRLIDNELKGKDTAVDELLSIVKGPDFPTGGMLLGDSYKDIYRTGHGTALIQATYEIEGTKKKSIVFTSVPYEVNKADLVTKIAKYSKEHKLDVADVRDETGKEGVRIVVELKKDASVDKVLNNLLEHTDLRTSFSANMLCIVDGKPEVLDLKEMLSCYLKHQKEVVTKRTAYEKDKAEKRKHVVEGLILATEHIDAIIKIIRSAETQEDAKEKLIKKFKFSDVQAQTILDMRLRSITGLERQKLEDELASLIKEINRCAELLSDEKKLLRLIRKELLELKKKYADERKTGHLERYEEVNAEDLIEDEPCVVLRTHMGYVKRLKADGRSRLEYLSDDPGTVQGDYTEEAVCCAALSDVFFFTDTGRVLNIKAYSIEETQKSERGSSLAGTLKLSAGENVIAMEYENDYGRGRFLMAVTKNGKIKRLTFSSLVSVRSAGQIMIKLEEGDEVNGVLAVKEEDDVMIFTKRGYCLAYPVNSVRPMERDSYGMRAVMLGEGDEIVSIQKYGKGKEVLAVSEKGYAKRLKCDDVKLSAGHQSKGLCCFASGKEDVGSISKIVPIEDSENDILIISEETVTEIPINKVALYSPSGSRNRWTRLSTKEQAAENAINKVKEIAPKKETVLQD